MQLFATDLSPVSIDLRPYLGRLRTVDVGIGNRTLSFLFDTAGGLTVITPEVAKSIGCEPSGRLVVHRMDGEAVSFQSCGEQTLIIHGEKFHRELSVMDLMALLPEGSPTLGGIVSLHTFQDRILSVDLPNSRIALETAASARKKQAAAWPLRMRLARQAGGATLDAFVAVQAGKESLWFELDSSNLDDIFLAPHAWKLFFHSSPANMTSAPQDIELEVIGLPPEKVRGRPKDLIYDGALNQEWLNRYEVMIDLLSGEMWARRVVIPGK